MTTRYRLPLLTLACATILFGCGKDDQTILLVDVEQGTLEQAPASLSIHAYKVEPPSRIEIGSIADIPWETARKGLGLKFKDTAAGAVVLEAEGTPTGTAGPVTVTVVAKQSVGPVTLSFRPGTRPTTDAGVVPADGGGSAQDALPTDGSRGDAATSTPDASRDAATSVPDAIVPAKDTRPSTPDIAFALPDVPLSLADAAVDATLNRADAAVDATQTPLGISPPQRIVPSTGSYQYPPAIAVDPEREHVYVAWVEKDRTTSSLVVKVKRWNKTTATWSDSQALEMPGGRPQEDSPRLGIDAAGNVFLVWCQNRITAGTNVEGVWASHAKLSAPTAFSPPQKIAAGIATELSLGVSANGVAFIVYNLKAADDSGRFEIHTATYSGGTWNVPAAPLFPSTSTTSDRPTLAVSDVGTALVVFDRQANMHARTGAFFLTATDRTDTGNVDPTVEADVSERFVAMNTSGEGVLVWTRASLSEMAVSAYNPSTGWTPAKTFATGSFQDYFSAAMSDDGTIAVAYAQKTDTTFNLAVQTGKITGTFTTATYLESDNKSTSAFMTSLAGDDWDFSYPRFAVAPTGNKTRPDSMHLLFHKKESGTTSSLWGTRLADGTWTKPALVARTADLHALYATLDVANSGFGAYAFLYFDTKTPSPSADDMQVFAGFIQP